MHLQQHVCICETEDGFVLLDLRSERYIGIPRDAGIRLRRAICNWPLSGDSAHSRAADVQSDSEELLQQLMSRGLIALDDGLQSWRSRSYPIAVPTSARSEHVSRETKVQMIDFINLVIARMVTALKLRTRSLERIVLAVERRKSRTARSDSADRSARIEQMAAVYSRVRPLAFTARSACLVDSLMLIEFLALYGLFPDWVIGVRTQPFLAHSWVQHDGRVLNDSLENVLGYVPILSV